MAKSYVQYSADGATYSIPFQFISRDHISVTVAGVAAAFSWLSVSQIKLVTTPVKNAVVEIRRVTPNNVALVDYNDGSILAASDLDLNALQNLLLSQESDDKSEGALNIDSQGRWDGQGRRMAAVLAPQDPTDVVNKDWAETAMSSQLAQAIQKASDATGAASTAVQKATEAAASKDAAGVSQTAAKASADAASGAASTAVGSASTATQKATDATTAASTAIQKASDAVTAANTATQKASDASGSASTASTAATTAAQKAAAAAQSAIDAVNAMVSKLDKAGGALTGDLTVYRSGSAATGFLYLGNGTSRYLNYDGAGYNLNGADLSINGSKAWHQGNLIVVRPGMHGTVGDGVANDRPALQALIDAVPDGSTLLFLGGKYRLNAALSIVNKSVSLVSLGRGHTAFLCDGHGVVITTASLMTRVHVEGFLWQRTAADATVVGFNAITVNRPANLSSCTESGPVIKGNTFFGQFTGNGASQPSYTTAWSVAINLTAGWNSFVEDNFYRGKDGNYDGFMLKASDHSTPVNFHRNICVFANAMVYFTAGSFAEGLNATSNEAVAVLDGFFLDDGAGAPQFRIIGNHINCARFAVRAVNRPQGWVCDNLIYNWNNQGSAQGAGGYNFVAVQLEGSSSGCRFAIIRHNIIIGFRRTSGVTGATYGFVIQNSFGALLDGNTIVECQFGLNGLNTFVGRIFHNHFELVLTNLVNVPAGSATRDNTQSTLDGNGNPNGSLTVL